MGKRRARLGQSGEKERIGLGRDHRSEDGVGKEELIVAEPLLGWRRRAQVGGRGLLLQRRAVEKLLAASAVEFPPLVVRERDLLGLLLLLLTSAHLGDLVLDVRKERVDVVIGVDADGLGAAQRGGGVVAALLGEAEADAGGLLEEGLLEDGGGHLGDHALGGRRGGLRVRGEGLLGRAARRGGDVPGA